MSQRNRTSSKSLLQRLITARYQPPLTRQQMIMKQQQQWKKRRNNNNNNNNRNHANTNYWTGIYNGRFYRIPKLPNSSSSSNTSSSSSKNGCTLPKTEGTWRPLPVLPKLYTPMSPPAKIPSLQTNISSSSSSSSSSSTMNTATTAALTKTTKISCDTVKVFGRRNTNDHQQQRNEFYERLKQWMYANYGTLILNFGSICTLIGFTRSDVLELRYLSVTGSICAIAYHIATPPLRIPPLLWSSTFAVVNGYKIYEIVQEREGSVQLTTEQEEMYINFFMPHGVTPKQFEMIYAKAEVLHVKKGTFLIRQTEAYQHVDLVVAGTTRASALGRFLTAASTTPTAHEERVGGASGAWIGEMCLLERVWMKEQKSLSNGTQQTSSLPQNRRSSKSPSKESQQQQELGGSSNEALKESATNFTDTGNFEGNSNGKAMAGDKPGTIMKAENTTRNEEHINVKNSNGIAVIDEKNIPLRKPNDIPPNQQQQQSSKLKACRSMHTIVAQEDCVVLRWRHEVMEKLMEKSTDMRAALTRAMTAAIVGKVINFTVSRSNKVTNPTWATWLADWKYNAGAEITIEDDTTNSNNTALSSKSNTVMVDEAALSSKEDLPNYPIRKFR